MSMVRNTPPMEITMPDMQRMFAAWAMTLEDHELDIETANPIEQVFAKVRHWMRMAQARTIDAINERIARLVDGISQSECENYLRNAGYVSS